MLPRSRCLWYLYNNPLPTTLPRHVFLQYPVRSQVHGSMPCPSHLCMGLRMDDEVVKIAVGLRLGLPLCHPHLCSGCGAEVGEDGINGLRCRYSKGRHSRHATLNDIVKRSLDAAKIPSHLEPLDLYRSDGKRPDGASVVPSQRGKILVWDVTLSDSLAPSLRDIAIREPGAVTAAAEHRKDPNTHTSMQLVILFL